MINRGQCEFCGNPVTSLQDAAHRVRGWEVERGGGGANYILGRERQQGRIAHARCARRAVELERRGLRNQQELRA
jgi:hypothetical protein